jgi:thiamine-monophosphate kinase
MDEFQLIRRYFDRHYDNAGVVIGIGDDGAVLSPSENHQQIQVIDTLVEGVHFPPQTHAADIAYRAVAVNVSDVAAMGGSPRWMTLALTLSSSEHDWLRSFSKGLFEAADEFGVALVGGDTTRGPVVVVTVTVTAEIRNDEALLRSGAQVGDGIFVSGCVGDAAAGLSLIQRGENVPYLSQRFLRPTPRIALGQALVGRASAAIDVSDGLLGDLAKLLAASGKGGEIDLERLPVSSALRAKFSAAEQHQFALCGGDDYELCFTARPAAVQDMEGITRIGTVIASRDLVCRHHGDIVEVDASGYRHFS